MKSNLNIAVILLLTINLIWSAFLTFRPDKKYITVIPSDGISDNIIVHNITVVDDNLRPRITLHAWNDFAQIKMTSPDEKTYINLKILEDSFIFIENKNRTTAVYPGYLAVQGDDGVENSTNCISLFGNFCEKEGPKIIVQKTGSDDLELLYNNYTFTPQKD